MDSIALAVATIHLAVCPFTKVEESFNMQAMHDIFYHNTNISAYDHLEFPGVVPRTFLGSLFVCLVSSPFYFLVEYFQVGKFSVQLLVRCVLGACVIFSWSKFKSTIEYLFGEGVARWFLIISVSQFHFMFYLSRPLPNIMALPFVMFALHAWLRKQHTTLIAMSGICVIIFRAELVLFLGLLILFELFYLRLSISGLILRGIPIGIACLASTVAVDSYFWQRLLWPEGEVLYFNTVLNGSVDYGTHPYLWYFYSALPRALGASLFLIPSSLVWDKRIRRLVTPALAFILLYSFLPHKELRFIIYSFPVLNVAAAYTCNLLWTRRAKSFLHKCVSLAILGHVVINLTITYFLLSISAHNYPGGVAISTLHKIEPAHARVEVHIDNYAAQTGVTRFTLREEGWTYNKTEYLKPGSPELMAFTHLIVEAKSKYSPNLKPYVKTHNIISIIEAFSHLQFSYGNFLHNVVTIKTRPSLFILKRKDLIEGAKGGEKSGESGSERRDENGDRRRKSRERSEERRSSEKVVVEEREERVDEDDVEDGNVGANDGQRSRKIDAQERVGRGKETGSKEAEIGGEKSKEMGSIGTEIGGKMNGNGKTYRGDNGNAKDIEKDLDKEKRLKGDDRTGRIREDSGARQSGRIREDDEVDGVDSNERADTKMEEKEEEVQERLKEKEMEESVRESIKERLKASIKESLQVAKEKRRGKGERDDTEKILLPINMDELSKGDFVGTKYEEEVCANCHGKVSEEMEAVGKQEKVNSIREDIKRKILKMKLREKMERREERETSDEYIHIEDE